MFQNFPWNLWVPAAPSPWTRTPPQEESKSLDPDPSGGLQPHQEPSDRLELAVRSPAAPGRPRVSGCCVCRQL